MPTEQGTKKGDRLDGFSYLFEAGFYQVGREHIPAVDKTRKELIVLFD